MTAAVWPNGTKSRPQVSSRFGDSEGRTSSHNGTDFINLGTVYAVSRGKVTHAGTLNGSLGIVVAVDVWDSINGETVTHRYAHLERAHVGVGDWVTGSEDIGLEGYTGTVSPPGPRGRHLHFEVARIRGGVIQMRYDPERWIAARLAPSLAGGGSEPFPKEDEMNETDRMMLKAIFESVRDRKPGVWANGTLMQLVKEMGVRVKVLAGQDGTLSDEDVAAIVDGIVDAGVARQVADEIARRLAS